MFKKNWKNHRVSQFKCRVVVEMPFFFVAARWQKRWQLIWSLTSKGMTVNFKKGLLAMSQPLVQVCTDQTVRFGDLCGDFLNNPTEMTPTKVVYLPRSSFVWTPPTRCVWNHLSKQTDMKRLAPHRERWRQPPIPFQQEGDIYGKFFIQKFTQNQAEEEASMWELAPPQDDSEELLQLVMDWISTMGRDEGCTKLP